MPVALPSRLRSYKVCAASPTDELLALGHVYAGFGDYAASFLDREHLSVARFCSARLKKMVPMLIERNAISKEDDLYDMEEVEATEKDFGAMSIDELYRLYRRWPLRKKARAAEGREHFTFYYEGRIVSELRKRRAADKTEQFKKDYCFLTYENELENLSFVFDVPVSVDDDVFNFDPEREYTPTELTAIIKLYANYRSVTERELLVEYVDYALDLIENAQDKALILALATEIAELGRKQIISTPAWVTDIIAEGIKTAADSDKALPLLTLALIQKDQSLERQAQRIINRCYKECLTTPTIDTLYTSVMCSEYVTRFSVPEMASAWNILCKAALTSETASTSDIVKLLEIAEELVSYAKLSKYALSSLLQELKDSTSQHNIEADIRLRRWKTARINSSILI